MSFDDSIREMLGSMSLEEFASALEEGRLRLDWGGPAKTLGERLARGLWVDAMNQKLEEVGHPFRIERVPATEEAP